MTPGALAKKMETSKVNIFRWRTGQSIPNLDNALKFARMYREHKGHTARLEDILVELATGGNRGARRG